MRIALAQINTIVGAFDENLEALRISMERAAEQGVRLVVAPELLVTGCPPRDFLKQRAFITAAAQAVERWLQRGTPQGVAVYFGTVEGQEGGPFGLYNTGLLVENGAILARAHQCVIPSSSVVEGRRYFDAAPEPVLAVIDGVPIGLTVGDELTVRDVHAVSDGVADSQSDSDPTPVAELVSRGARLVINCAASPYAVGQSAVRQNFIGSIARRHGVPVAVADMVGGNDGIVFDGRSLIVTGDGQVEAIGPAFGEALIVADVEVLSPTSSDKPADKASMPPPSPVTPPMTPLADEISVEQLDDLHTALVAGVRDYVHKSGFDSAVIGLSGGIDSALVAEIAVRALSPEKVLTVALPSRYTSDMSNEDARKLAENLGVRHLSLSIEEPYQAHMAVLSDLFAGLEPGLAEENVQARVRGALLMAISNKFGSLLLPTGNKSELATGYCTLYGDMAGALAVLGDVPKTLVYALSRRINERHVEETGSVLIPERIIIRPPSAELRENQTDQDSLPPYEELDRVLRRFVEAGQGAAEIEEAEPDIPRQTIDRILSLIRINEYKRRQAAPVLKVSPRAFGEDVQLPLAHGFRG